MNWWIAGGIGAVMSIVSGLLTLWSAYVHRCQGFSSPCSRWDSKVRPCMTAYSDMRQNVNPMLCDDCAKEYEEYWDGMWREYYNGRL